MMALEVVWKKKLWNGMTIMYGKEVLANGAENKLMKTRFQSEYDEIGCQIVKSGRCVLARTHHPDVGKRSGADRTMALINLVCDDLLRHFNGK